MIWARQEGKTRFFSTALQRMLATRVWKCQDVNWYWPCASGGCGQLPENTFICDSRCSFICFTGGRWEQRVESLFQRSSSEKEVNLFISQKEDDQRVDSLFQRSPSEKKNLFDLRELATASERHVYSGAVDKFFPRVHVPICLTWFTCLTNYESTIINW